MAVPGSPHRRSTSVRMPAPFPGATTPRRPFPGKRPPAALARAVSTPPGGLIHAPRRARNGSASRRRLSRRIAVFSNTKMNLKAEGDGAAGGVFGVVEWKVHVEGGGGGCASSGRLRTGRAEDWSDGGWRRSEAVDWERNVWACRACLSWRRGAKRAARRVAGAWRRRPKLARWSGTEPSRASLRAWTASKSLTAWAVASSCPKVIPDLRKRSEGVVGQDWGLCSKYWRD